MIPNTAAIREALEFIKLASDDYEKYGTTKAGALDVIYEKACAALATPPRNCDIMSLETARRVWFAKEIVPRLDGDLPLGKEVPFEDWFVSQQEQGESK